MYTFKDLVAAGVLPDTTESEAYLAYRAQKRKRGILGGTIGGPVNEDYVQEDQEAVFEELTLQQRQKKRALMKRLKAKIKRGRERSLKKTATPEKLKARAQRRARMAIFKKLSQGKSKSDMSFADRKAVEKRLENKKSLIARMAKKMLPQVRKDDRARRQMVGKQDEK